jgi:transcriptional regulator GlxA family with amidase domain
LADGIGVNDLARAAGQSPRTFARRVAAATGMSPIGFLQQIRVERAIELLETSVLPFEEIAYQVGYSDPSTLRTLIRRGSGFGPRDVRARARAAIPGSYGIPGNQNEPNPRAA